MTASQGVSPAYHLQQVFWRMIDWLYPPHCAGCGRLNDRWCAECKGQLLPIDHHKSCPKCDYPSIGQGVCPDCSKYKPYFTALRSYAIYTGPFRNTIHRLKYHSDFGLAEILAVYLAQLLEKTDWQPDLVLAVPLSAGRQRQRGYNQSAILAQTLAWQIRLPYTSGAISRIVETNSQVGLDGFQRRRNVEHAFRAEPKICSQKNVLIIDDVATTGATLSACAQALRHAGADQILALTLARAIHLDLS